MNASPSNPEPTSSSTQLRKAAGAVFHTMVALRFKVALALVLTLAGRSTFAAPTNSVPDWPKADPAAVERWQAMRFGMFIHWGPVSLTGKEIGWSRGAQTSVEAYDNLYKEFNPTNYNADEWVSVAKAAGMKTSCSRPSITTAFVCGTPSRRTTTS